MISYSWALDWRSPLRFLTVAALCTLFASCRDALTTDGLLVVEDDNKYPNAALFGPRIESMGFQVVDSWGDSGTWTGATTTGPARPDRHTSGSRVVVIFARTGVPPTADPSGREQ